MATTTGSKRGRPAAAAAGGKRRKATAACAGGAPRLAEGRLPVGPASLVPSPLAPAPISPAPIALEAIAAAAAGLGGAIRLIEWVNADPANERTFWGTIFPKLLSHQDEEAGDAGPIDEIRWTVVDRGV